MRFSDKWFITPLDGDHTNFQPNVQFEQLMVNVFGGGHSEILHAAEALAHERGCHRSFCLSRNFFRLM